MACGLQMVNTTWLMLHEKPVHQLQTPCSDGRLMRKSHICCAVLPYPFGIIAVSYQARTLTLE